MENIVRPVVPKPSFVRTRVSPAVPKPSFVRTKVGRHHFYTGMELHDLSFDIALLTTMKGGFRSAKKVLMGMKAAMIE